MRERLDIDDIVTAKQTKAPVDEPCNAVAMHRAGKERRLVGDDLRSCFNALLEGRKRAMQVLDGVLNLLCFIYYTNFRGPEELHNTDAEESLVDSVDGFTVQFSLQFEMPGRVVRRRLRRVRDE